MRQRPFTRPTILAAIELLKHRESQAGFEQMVLRVGLESAVQPDTKPKMAAAFGRAVMQHVGTTVDTLAGTVTLGEAVVREAVAQTSSFGVEKQDEFIHGLALDGYVVEWSDSWRPRLLAALPEEIELAETDDEVHQLLKLLGFSVPMGHLDQAIEAHMRGDWAAANSQARTFVEGLFEAIAHREYPAEAAALSSSENRRQLLNGKGFLDATRNEYSADGRGFINGLFRMLHTHGSHPGLSDEDHCTMRLHLILVTAHAFLRRVYYRK
jgi:hypothetical protein